MNGIPRAFCIELQARTVDIFDIAKAPCLLSGIAAEEHVGACPTLSYTYLLEAGAGSPCLKCLQLHITAPSLSHGREQGHERWALWVKCLCK